MAEISGESLNQFITEYYQLVVKYAQKNLGQYPHAAFDAEDVAVSAFRSLLKHVESKDDRELLDRSVLVRLLFSIARKKSASAIRHESAQKRSRTRLNQSIDLNEIAVTDTSHEIAIMRDLFGSLILKLPEKLKDVARLKLDGHTNAEVAVELNVTERTVERHLARIREFCLDVFR